MREEITLTKKEVEAIIDHLEELPMKKVKNLVAFFNSKLQEPMPELKDSRQNVKKEKKD